MTGNSLNPDFQETEGSAAPSPTDAKAAHAPKPAPETGSSNSAQVDLKSRKRIGEQLVDAGIITEHQLRVALHEKKQRGNQMLGETLVSLGFIDAGFLSSFLSKSSGVDKFDAKTNMVDPEVVQAMPKEDALRYQVLPVSQDDQVLRVAMVDPYDVVATDKVRQHFPADLDLEPMLCTPAELRDAIDNIYGNAVSIEGILKELSDGQPDLTNISEEEAYSHPIVRLVNAFVLQAVKQRASDLHFEPEEHFVRLRYRIDGVLHEVQNFHKEYWDAIAQRLKILSEMNIADKLNPQDGRFRMTVGGREVDFRVSALPTVYGENFVLRVLV